MINRRTSRLRTRRLMNRPLKIPKGEKTPRKAKTRRKPKKVKMLHHHSPRRRTRRCRLHKPMRRLTPSLMIRPRLLTRRRRVMTSLKILKLESHLMSRNLPPRERPQLEPS